MFSFRLPFNFSLSSKRHFIWSPVILFGLPSFYLVSLHFNRFTQHKHKDQGLSVFATICYFQVANVSSSSMLRHYSLSGFGSLGVLYIGILPAVSPVRLECIFAKVAVRINEDSLVHFICRNCSMSNTFCCKSASNGFREDRMKTAEILWMEEDKSIVQNPHSDMLLTRKSTNIWKKGLGENRGWSLYSALYVGCFCPTFPCFEAFFSLCSTTELNQ